MPRPVLPSARRSAWRCAAGTYSLCSQQLRQTIVRFGWNHSRAAKVLAIGRTSLWRKLKEYQIEQRVR